MNLLLWILQVALALHTVMGAVWKFSHSEQAAPSLQAIPHGLWLAMIPFELLCAVALVVPLVCRPLASVAPVAALGVLAEMLLFSGVHLSSGATRHGQLVYWLVVGALCVFIAGGRFVLSPIVG